MGFEGFLNMIKFINFKNNWILKRIPTITSIFIDITIVNLTLLYFVKTNFLVITSFWGNVFQSIMWCLLSYVAGRYVKKKISLNGLLFLNYLKKTLIITSIIIIINLVAQNLFIYSKIELIKFFIIPLKVLVYISGLSLIMQFIKEFLFNKVFNNKLYYLFFGELSEIDELKELCKKNNLQNHIFEKYSPKIKDFSKYSYILIKNAEFQNLDKVSSIVDLNKNNLTILTKIEWCSAVLEKIPSEYLLDDEIEVSSLLRISRNRSLQLKRTLDIFASLFLLLVFFPIIIFTIITILIEDGLPIFYLQNRHGINNKIIKLAKFRSMLKKAEKNGPVWAKKNDSRVTKIGKYLRLLRIDEIPQLLLVIKGEMSIVGPRPERPEIDKILDEQIPLYYLRYKTLPGISGWAQVNYPYGSSIKDAREKLSYDLFYIRNQSFLLDIIIMLKTIRRVLTASGSNPN